MGLIKDIKDIESSELSFYSSNEDWKNAWKDYITKNSKTQLYDVTKNTSDELKLYFTSDADLVYNAARDIFGFLGLVCNNFSDYVPFVLNIPKKRGIRFNALMRADSSSFYVPIEDELTKLKNRGQDLQIVYYAVVLDQNLNIIRIRIELL